MNLGLWKALGNPMGEGLRSGGAGDTVAPTVTITSTESSPSYKLSIPLTITFSEAVTGFVVGDITVSGCTLSGFATADNITFTVNAAPTAYAITVDIAQGVCTDAAGNGNAAATQFAINSMASALVMALNCNEASGERADATGRGNAAAETGTTTFGTGIVGNAAKSANWATGYLTVTYGADLALGDVDWWVSAWINPAALTGYPTFISQSTAAGIDWNIWIDSDQSKFQFSAGATNVSSALVVTAGTLYNVQVGYLAATDKMFISVNGEAKVEVAKAGGITDNSRTIRFGKFDLGSGAPNNSLIDRVYRYTSAWTATLGNADYNAGAPKELVP